MDIPSQLHKEVCYGSCCNLYLLPIFATFPVIREILEYVFSLKLEKLSFSPATTVLREKGDFSVYTGHPNMRWFPLQTIQRAEGYVVAVGAGCYVLSFCVLAANVLEASLDLIFEMIYCPVLVLLIFVSSSQFSWLFASTNR